MSRKVLVLNADYSALSICTVPKAFLLVYLDKAELVTDSPKGMLRTVNKSYPLPLSYSLASLRQFAFQRRDAQSAKRF